MVEDLGLIQDIVTDSLDGYYETPIAMEPTSYYAKNKLLSGKVLVVK